MLRRTAPLAAAGALATCLFSAGNASAFSTRIHIALANDVREALIASNDGSIPLRFSGHRVILSQQDADALEQFPLAFRAGAVGPDNMAFPGMTDPSHALEQRPFEQCQLLYDAAVNNEERAYAMGCFLHGASDAVAHHYVNYMTGETFTLTPITNARETSYTNVVRHIVAEGMIQDAAYALDPSAFTTGQLAHALPKGFILRAYFGEQSPLWQMMASRAKAEFDDAKAQNPGASLVTVISSANLAPADHLVLAPEYLREIERSRQGLRKTVEDRIAELQSSSTTDGATLGVTAGQDGTLGTEDDQTACSVSCPSLYATYKVYVALLAPRFDAGNNMLPSAFDKLSDKLGDDLDDFMPAYLDTTELISAKVNEPLQPGASSFAIEKSDIATLFAPMTAWSTQITTIDYETLTQAVLPDWLLSVQNALNAVGVNIQVSNIVEGLFQPVVQPVKDAVKNYVIDQAETYIGDLVDELEATEGAILSEYDSRLVQVAPTGLGGTALDNLYDSGLYAHSFNIAATALANHQAVLPVGDDPVGIGPASFDASHVPSWMQAGRCDYLREAVFPLGLDLQGTLSVQVSTGQVFTASVSEDSPIECHDGSLSSFTSSPSQTNCSLVDVEGLKLDPAHRGSVSRAYPPVHADTPGQCENITVAGLPEPPMNPGTGGTAGGGGMAGGAAGGSAGSSGSGAASGSSGSSGSAGTTGASSSSGDSGGCGCEVAGGDMSRGGAWLGLALAAGAAARRRKRGVQSESEKEQTS